VITTAADNTPISIVATGAGVSFAHGSNDGQKGIGLIMIILIGILPNYYALNMDSHHYRITQTKDAASNLAKFYEDNSETIVQLVNEKRLISALKTNKTIAECNVEQIHSTISSVASKLNNLNSYSELSTKDRWSVRTSILCTDNFFAQAEKIYLILDKDKSDYITSQRKLLVAPIEYAPYWVIMAVALAIGIGTMIGYQRIVHTIGEKIGAKPINYMQGTVAQATAMITILLANFAHAPVSTTHILSSAVTGSMVAEPDGGVQKGTIKIILLSWLFTLPVTALLGSALYMVLNFFMK
jgi:PiT family inorganic phosphate transporter/low-affinity inorganic phosphate transporter